MKSIVKFIITAIYQTAQVAIAGLRVAVFSKPPTALGPFRPPEITDCVILGNGPSLKDSLAEHADFLRGKKTLCTNDFADSEYFERIKPDYYIFTDPTYWSPHASPRFQKVFADYHHKLQQVNWPIVIFMPMAARRWNYFSDLPEHNRFIRMCYFNTTEVRCFRALRFWFYRHNLAVPVMQNVMVAGIFVCLNMGFTRNYLLGGDHSWHESLYIDDHNRLFLTNTRFQDKVDGAMSPFFEDPRESEPYRMSNLFRAFSRMYYGYEELEAYATSIGAKIYNASKKSYIDAFERYRLGKTDA